MTNQEKYDNITLLSDNSVILSKNRGEKMRPLNDELAAKILEAGKNEFLEKGFRKASVRSIAAAVNVTTGAVYR